MCFGASLVTINYYFLQAPVHLFLHFMVQIYEIHIIHYYFHLQLSQAYYESI